MKHNKLSVIIPVFNEEKNVLPLILELQESLKDLVKKVQSKISKS